MPNALPHANHWQPAVSASRHWKQKLQLKQNETKAYSTVRHTVTTTSGERPTSPSRWHYNWLTFEPCNMLDTVLYKQASTNLWNWSVAHLEKYLSSRKEWEDNQPLLTFMNIHHYSLDHSKNKTFFTHRGNAIYLELWEFCAKKLETLPHGA